MLRLGAVPVDIVAGDKCANIMAVDGVVRSMPQRPDVIVLPELFATSFIPDRHISASLAEDNDGMIVTEIMNMASKYDAAFIGTFLAEGADGRIYNRAFFVCPDGGKTFYDKRHVFSIGMEGEVVSPGSSPIPVVGFRGWNVAMAVCYDLRFPCWLRNTGLKYDVLVIPANWPSSRAYAWNHLLVARAIENQAYVVGANRSGSDRFGDYSGCTSIYDYLGRSIGSVPEGGVVTADFDKDSLEKFRAGFPVWRDAD